MQPASELLAVPGAMLVGPIPLEVQTYIVYSGAVSAGRARPGRAPTRCCRPARIRTRRPLLKKKGMELP